MARLLSPIKTLLNGYLAVQIPSVSWDTEQINASNPTGFIHVYSWSPIEPLDSTVIGLKRQTLLEYHIQISVNETKANRTLADDAASLMGDVLFDTMQNLAITGTPCSLANVGYNAPQILQGIHFIKADKLVEQLNPGSQTTGGSGLWEYLIKTYYKISI